MGTWSLSATGTIPLPEGADLEALEEELHAEVQAVLSQPKFGCTGSRFTGGRVDSFDHPGEVGACADVRHPPFLAAAR